MTTLSALQHQTAEDKAINRFIEQRFGVWPMADHDGTAHVAASHDFCRMVTLHRVRAHDARFNHHSSLATDLDL